MLTDYGRRFGPFWWRYPLHRAVPFMTETGYDLWYYGVTIPGTRYGVGLIVRRRIERTER